MSDIVIIGGGIVGLATAFRLQERLPGRQITILEKEDEIARHQSSHNSGVLHTGIYYRPGSLRAENCRTGRAAMVEFCEREGVPFEICGKVIVAVEPREAALLERIYERGQANGVRSEVISPERLRELEPHVAGIGAIHLPDAGIVDFRLVCDALARRIAGAGGEIRVAARVRGIDRRADRLVVRSTAGEVETRFVVNCAGLHSDRVARLTGASPPVRIVPFRGDYYTLRPEARELCRNLVYPVPYPDFPFLGVHLIRMMDGVVECGPNAALALAREGYAKSSVNARDLLDSLTYPGVFRLIGRHWRETLAEGWRSLSKAAFLAAVQRLVPEVRSEDLAPGGAGIRAQAVDRQGRVLDDFLILESDRVVNVCNAPSPAATASLNIGRVIAERVVARMSR